MDADALPASERPNPAAPSAVREAALVLHFCFAARLTRGMASSFRRKVCVGEPVFVSRSNLGLARACARHNAKPTPSVILALAGKRPD